MALLNSSLIRCVLRRPHLSAFGKSFGVSVNKSDKNNSQRNYATIVSSSMDFVSESDEHHDITKEKLSKAAKAYLERAQKYEEMMSEARSEYRIGMRHLANMMGENPDTFTQGDANDAVAYLFPSGVYDKKARPYMKPPEEIFPARKAPQFDRTGRPFLSMFYTVSPHFYRLCHEAVGHMKELDKHEDACIREQKSPDPEAKLDLHGSVWFTKEQLQDHIVEDVSDRNYFEYVKMMDRLAAHPYAYLAREFIFRNRHELQIQRDKLQVAVPTLGEDGRSYVTIYGCYRKTAKADVTTISPGTGSISINGHDIAYFHNFQARQQSRQRRASGTIQITSDVRHREIKFLQELLIGRARERVFGLPN